MGTPLKTVYEAFLARIEQNEWTSVAELEIAEDDWRMLLNMAINRFMFPRISLEIIDVLTTEGKLKSDFAEVLTQSEIQVLSTFMKNEWLKRQLASWQLIRQQYSTQDFKMFSPANLIGKLQDMISQSDDECVHIINVYERAIAGKPFNWSKLAGTK